MLPLRPSSTTSMNIFGEVWIAHENLSSSSISYRGQTIRFNTPRFVPRAKSRIG